MSYQVLPIDLQQLFQRQNDRISRLELAYNGPQASADAASTQAVSAQSLALQSYSVATDAQTQAINAGIQAVQAQSQATIASTQATYAVTTANGKNTVSYGTASPPSGTHTTGDLYFQFNGSNQVIAQYTWNGSSWVSNPITSTVIASINAGSIISGTITGIEYNNGSGTFHVTPTGALTASSANITGNIVATTGYFGGYGTTGNYWSIGSSGITGVGTATITGGQINGSSLDIGSGTFQVNSTGSMTATAGTIAGFTISPTTGLSTAGGMNLNPSGSLGCTTVTTSGQIWGNSFLGGASMFSVTSGGAITGQELTVSGGAVYLTGLESTYTTSSSANVYVNSSSGLLARSTSSARYKVDITPQTIDFSTLMSLTPKSFIDKGEYTANNNSANGLKRYLGLIAEEVAQIPTLKDFLVAYDEQGQPDSINYDRIAVAMIPLLQDLQNRVTKLEGANGTGTSTTN